MIVGIGLDKDEVFGRVGPLEIQTGVAVDGHVQANDAARGIRRDPVQVPEAFLELIARPEDGLEQRRRHLTDAAGHAWHCFRPVVA